MDGIPAFSCKTKSLKPLQLVCLSHRPAIRVRAENILLLMLIPDDIDHEGQRKYFDFAASYELEDVFTNGQM